MSPLLEPPAARPHATDPAPCLNRCSINACFSATHLPGGHIEKRRADARWRWREGWEWVSVWRKDKGEGERARTQKPEWLLGDGLAVPEEAKRPVNLGMKCSPYPICSDEGQEEERSTSFWVHSFKPSPIYWPCLNVHIGWEGDTQVKDLWVERSFHLDQKLSRIREF